MQYNILFFIAYRCLGRLRLLTIYVLPNTENTVFHEPVSFTTPVDCCQIGNILAICFRLRKLQLTLPANRRLVGHVSILQYSWS